MVPFIVLLVSFVILRSVGFLGLTALDNTDLPLRIALCLMFLLTASAHWGKGRSDLVRMVPPVFAHPEALVTVTGVLEILGAIGLLLPITSRLAAVCLAILLSALFPANIRAAREHLSILGRPAPGLVVRGAIQLAFLSALIAVVMHESHRNRRPVKHARDQERDHASSVFPDVSPGHERQRSCLRSEPRDDVIMKFKPWANATDDQLKKYKKDGAWCEIISATADSQLHPRSTAVAAYLNEALYFTGAGTFIEPTLTADDDRDRAERYRRIAVGLNGWGMH